MDDSQRRNEGSQRRNEGPLPPRRDHPASPPSRRSYSGLERRQTSPNELLARRVLTIDAYRQELRDPRRRLERDREIPVPLWPGESLGQFEREFGRWLDERRVSVAALRGNPVEERDHRMQFAQARVARGAIRREDVIQDSRFATAPPPLAPRSELWSRSPPRVLIRRSRSRSRSPARVLIRRSRSRSPSPRDLIRRSRSPPRVMFRRARSRSPRRVLSRRSRSRSPPRETRRHATAEAMQFVRRPAQVAAEHHDRDHSRDRQTPYSRLPVEGLLRVDRDGLRYVADSPRWNPAARSPSPSPRYSRAVSPRHERLPSSPRGSALPSRSRSPPSLSSSVSSPRGRRSSPSRRPELSYPRNDGIFRKSMLARRVLTVEDYRKEANELSKGSIKEDDLRRPGESVVRIPVLLKPGEWMKLYKDQLEVWLNARRLSLASVSGNPAEERRYWFAYAHSRAWPTSEPLLPNKDDAVARVPLRSRSRSPLRKPRRSSERGHSRKESPSPPHKQESTKTPRDSSSNSQTRELPPWSDDRSSSLSILSPSSSALATESPRLFRGKSRGQILLRRELSVEAFEKEVGRLRRNPEGKKAECSDDILPAIPVPLLPGETMRFYDHKFWVWLARRNMTKESLRSDAVQERQLRMIFAYMRVPESPASKTVGTDEKRTTPTDRGTPEKAKVALGALRAQRPRLPLSLKRNLSKSGQQCDSPRAKESKRPVVEVKLEQLQTYVIPELPPSLPLPTSKKQMRSLHSMEALERLSSSLKPPPAPSTPSLRRIAPKPVHQGSGVTSGRPSAPSSPLIAQESVTQGIDATATATPVSAAISSGKSPVAPTTPIAPIAASDKVTNTTEFSAAMVSTANAKFVVDATCHDGDLLNPNGCCCSACMRSWALMLTSRMDKLEGDVMGLREDINSGGSIYPAALTSHQA